MTAFIISWKQGIPIGTWSCSHCGSTFQTAVLGERSNWNLVPFPLENSFEYLQTCPFDSRSTYWSVLVHNRLHTTVKIQPCTDLSLSWYWNSVVQQWSSLCSRDCCITPTTGNSGYPYSLFVTAIGHKLTLIGQWWLM